MKEIIIQKNEAGQRLDKYLKKLLKEAPTSFFYKMMRKKNIVLNGKKATGAEKLQEGDCVKLFLSDETLQKFEGKAEAAVFTAFPKVKLEIVYEDEDILAINKPSGMLSQKAEKDDISANEYILQYLLKSGTITEESLRTFKPSVCNRLDRNTSGILIAGKTLCGSQKISKALKERSVKKYYLCLVAGTIHESKRMKGYLVKDEETNSVTVTSYPSSKEAKPIVTEYRPLEHLGNATLLEVHLITGRSHQIRAHLASIGHPVIGDAKYGNREINREFRERAGVTHQLLHAYRLILEDGTVITAEPSKEFQRAKAYAGNET